MKFKIKAFTACAHKRRAHNPAEPSIDAKLAYQLTASQTAVADLAHGIMTYAAARYRLRRAMAGPHWHTYWAAAPSGRKEPIHRSSTKRTHVLCCRRNSSVGRARVTYGLGYCCQAVLADCKGLRMLSSVAAPTLSRVRRGSRSYAGREDACVAPAHCDTYLPLLVVAARWQHACCRPQLRYSHLHDAPPSRRLTSSHSAPS